MVMTALWPPQHPAHGTLHGTIAEKVQGFLADVSCSPQRDVKAFAVRLVYPRRRSLSVFGYRDLAEHSTAEIDGSANHEKKNPQ